MSCYSVAMNYFRQNVMHLITTEKIGVSGLVDRMNRQRRKRKQEKEVSRTFVSNLLHGRTDCSLPFAEEVAAAVNVPLPDLLSRNLENLRQPA